MEKSKTSKDKTTKLTVFKEINLISISYDAPQTHHEASLKFDNLEELETVYNKLFNNLDKGYIWYNDDYTLYPHIYDNRVYNSSKIDELSIEELKDYIKNGKTYLCTNLDFNKYYPNLDYLNVKYVNTPAFILNNKKYITTCILVNRCYYLENFNKSEIEIQNIFNKNKDIIQKQMDSFNYNYLYSITIQLTYLIDGIYSVLFIIKGCSIK